MTNIEKLMAAGAVCVGGDVVKGNKLMGTLRHGDFYPTPDGLAFLAADDVEVKSETPKAEALEQIRRKPGRPAKSVSVE